MYIALTLFFTSLLGIMFMIGRKVRMVRAIGIMEKEFENPFISDLQKIKSLSIIGVKKLGHMGVVSILRLQVKTTNFLKNKFNEMIDKVRELNYKNELDGSVKEKVEISKFLSVISEYKKKIRDIKYKIHEEEGSL